MSVSYTGVLARLRHWVSFDVPLHLSIGKLLSVDLNPIGKLGCDWTVMLSYGCNDKQTDRPCGLVCLVSFGNWAKNNTVMNRA